MPYDPQSVWLVTGSTSGLGECIIQSVRSRGMRAIATARDASKLQHLKSEQCAILQLDVTSSSTDLTAKAEEAMKIWGRVDVLVNNAGISVIGAVEELGEDAFMAQFQTNFFAPLNLINAFLPYMRKVKSGTIVNIGSRSSSKSSTPMFGAYGSSKAALHFISKTLSAELAHVNIRVLLVEPGSLRTANISQSSYHSHLHQDSARLLPEYAHFREAVERVKAALDGKQTGDPKKAAEVIVDCVCREGRAKGKRWPYLLALGEDAEKDIVGKCKEVLECVEEWKDVCRDINV